jgi:hypothetical protein
MATWSFASSRSRRIRNHAQCATGWENSRAVNALPNLTAVPYVAAAAVQPLVTTRTDAVRLDRALTKRKPIGGISGDGERQNAEAGSKTKTPGNQRVSLGFPGVWRGSPSWTRTNNRPINRQPTVHSEKPGNALPRGSLASAGPLAILLTDSPRISPYFGKTASAKTVYRR